MAKTMRVTVSVALLLVAFVVAGHVVPSARGKVVDDAVSSGKPTGVPAVEAQPHSGKRALVLAAGHVVPPAGGDGSKVVDDTVSSGKPTIEAQPHSGKGVVPPARADNAVGSGKPTGVPAVEAPHSGKLAPDKRNDDDLQAADLYEGIKVTTVEDFFDLAHSNGEKYLAFMSDVDFFVNKTAARQISGRPVLRPQRLMREPESFLSLAVNGEGGQRVSFLIRTDNLYIIAFTNRHGVWAFLPQGNQYRLPRARFLSFGGGYPDLFGEHVGWHGFRDQLKINGAEATKHLAVLANHAGGRDLHLKEPLAFFLLILCEAERFPPIRRAVAVKWDREDAELIKDTFRPGGPVILQLVVNWRVFSCAVLAWDKHGGNGGTWTSRSNQEAQQVKRLFGVATAQQALSTITPILQPSRCSWWPA